MLEVVDVLLLPIEGEHVLIRPADLLEALPVRASGPHVGLEALPFVGGVDFLVGRSVQHSMRIIVLE